MVFNIKNLILGIGIVVVFGLALWQGIEAFYPSPQYDDFCTAGRFEAYYPKVVPPAESCIYSQELRDAEAKCYSEKGQPIYEYDDKGCYISVKTCDYCQRDLEEALDKHSKIVFIIAVIVGVIALIIGYGVLSIEPVGSALIGSGIWAIFWGAAINWRNFSSIWRFLLLFTALILIVWFALRLNRRKEKGFLERIGLRK